MKSNIVLTGFMGAGKTTIGHILARELDMNFIDLDAYIVQTSKMTINSIFEKYGEKYFRDLETKACMECGEKENAIISTGGGVILRDENIEYLKKKGVIYFLSAEPETIYNRIKHSKDRPLLKVADPLGKIKELLDGRVERYNSTCDEKLVTDNNVVEEIITKIKKKYLNT